MRALDSRIGGASEYYGEDLDEDWETDSDELEEKMNELHFN